MLQYSLSYTQAVTGLPVYAGIFDVVATIQQESLVGKSFLSIGGTSVYSFIQKPGAANIIS